MTTGSTIARFTITLSKSVAEPVQVAWNTKDGTAKAGIDYAGASGTAVFSPGETNKDVDVLVYGRAVGTEDRNFFLEMTPPPNAILGESIGECIIYLDTAGNTAVIQVIVPTGQQGAKGDSAYQSWLNLGNTGTEQDFIDSLSPPVEEIAAEVAPILDIGSSLLTAEGTETLSKPDTMTGKRLARRVAYVGAAKVATVVLADGDNLITHADLSGDAVDFNSISLYPRILRGTVVISPEWSVEPGDKLLIKSAVAGDVLHICQYDVISERAVKNVVEPLVAPVGSQAFEALRRSYAEAGYNVVGTFREGFTIVNANDVGIDDTTGKGYTGPAGVVAAGTNPASGGFVDRSGALLLSRLASDSGADLVFLKPSGVSAAVKRALSEVVYDEIVNVNWFGAVGDWNAATQTGADDNNAFQAALDYYATLGTKREGGKRAIEVPAGCFRISAVTARAAMGFGIDFKGAGKNATSIYADPSNPNPAITSEIEFVNFKSMSLFGALSVTSNSSLWKGCFYKGKLASNLADIDVRFSDCIVGYATDFVQAYGRGVIFDAGTTAVRCINLLNIVCDPSTVFTGAENDTLYTGMRHYSFLGMRADVVSKLVKITGTAAHKDHIHGIQFVGCDLAACDRLIDGDDATIRGALLSGNESLDSFAGGVVTVKSAVRCTDQGNHWFNLHGDAVAPSSPAHCIQWLWKTTGAIAGLSVTGTQAKGLSYGVVSAGAASSDVKIVNNNFTQFCTFNDGNTNHWVFNSPANCAGLVIGGNTFGSSSIAGTYQLFDATVQTSPRTRTFANLAPWSWADMRLRYTPKLLINGVQSATAPTSAFGRFWMDDQYVNVEFMLGINPVEVTGNLSISLPPVTAIADSVAVTDSYGGNGMLSRVTGFSAAGSVAAPIQVNPATQEAELWRESGMVRGRITAADKSGLISIFGFFKYRY